MPGRAVLDPVGADAGALIRENILNQRKRFAKQKTAEGTPLVMDGREEGRSAGKPVL